MPTPRLTSLSRSAKIRSASFLRDEITVSVLWTHFRQLDGRDTGSHAIFCFARARKNVTRLKTGTSHRNPPV
jgi:hypothetical protein